MKCKHVNVRLYEHKALLFFGILVTTFTFICIAVLTNDLQKSSCGILFDNLIKFEIPSHKYNIALSSVYTTAIWSVAQVLYSFNVAIQLASSLEQHSFFVKYEGHNDNEKDQQTDKSPIEIMEVPTLHLQDCHEPHHVNTQSVCFNFKEQRYHGKAGRKDGNLDEWNQSLNLQKPLLIPNIWTTNIKVTGDDDDDDNNKNSNSINSFKPLTLKSLTQPPIGDLMIQYYSDSTKAGAAALKPDSIATLNEIVNNVTTYKNSTIKIGTQIPILSYPNLIENIAPNHIVTHLFGDRFQPSDLQPFLNIFPPLTTVPIFLARGLNLNKTTPASENRASSDDSKEKQPNVRTDLHCEPIGNVAVQLEGSKKWTLIDSQYSSLLKPTVSKHGRAFFYSTLNPLDPQVLDDIPHYEVITHPGDAIYIPPWTWHQVDYIPDEISFAASLFHLRPLDLVRSNALYSMLILPNLIKEISGWNHE